MRWSVFPFGAKDSFYNIELFLDVYPFFVSFN